MRFAAAAERAKQAPAQGGDCALLEGVKVYFHGGDARKGMPNNIPVLKRLAMALGAKVSFNIPLQPPKSLRSPVGSSYRNQACCAMSTLSESDPLAQRSTQYAMMGILSPPSCDAVNGESFSRLSAEQQVQTLTSA